jgi:hypothetical protein
MNKLKIAAAVVLTLASAASFAQSKNSSGFYGLANFGFSNVKGDGSGSFKDNNNVSIPYKSDNSSAGNSWSLGLGYDIDETFAVEGSYGSTWKQEQKWTSTHQYGRNYENNKTNVMALNLTALVKFQASENVKLFVGPTVSYFTLKGSDEQQDVNAQGQTYYSKNSSETIKKTLPGVVLGASFALDPKTDLRVSYTQFQKWEMGQPDSKETNQISNISFGLTIKF